MSQKAEEKSFFSSLGHDVIAGAISGFTVGPIVSSVDRALAENASGRCTLMKSFMNSMTEFVKHPIRFFKSPAFRYIWMVYGSTYVAANIADSYGERVNKDIGFAKWLLTSTVNTSTCLIKDRAYAKLFGTSAPTHVPMGSYLVWASRDILSMGVIFTMPPVVAREVAKVTGDEKLAYYSAQFALPLLLQTVSTPLHLLGFDIYNNPHNTVGQRLTFLKKDYHKNVAFRMARMIAPWSLGTIGNKELRGFFKKQHEIAMANL